MPGLFDLTGPAVTSDPGTIYDYASSLGDVTSQSFSSALDTNPMASAMRTLRYFSEDVNAKILGTSELVDAATARKEVASRGLQMTIPDNGISRYELDMRQFLKQREIQQQTAFMMPHSTAAMIAGTGAMVAGSVVDPLNVASAFIPVVGEARYANWLAMAGEGALARAAVRAQAGAIEGVVGAAALEPLNLYTSAREDRDYGLMDSFMNATVGGVLGGGLHMIGGGVWDALAKRETHIGQTMPDGSIGVETRVDHLPEQVQMDALQAAVRALEEDRDVDAGDFIEAWHGSPHWFDRFSTDHIGKGEGNQSYGWGLYFAEKEGTARSYRDNLAPNYRADVYIDGKKLPDTALWHIGETLGVTKEQALALRIIAERGGLNTKTKEGKWIAEDLGPDLLGKMKIEPRDNPGGHLYQVKIKANADEFVDLDKPFSAQPKRIQDALKAVGIKDGETPILEQVQAKTNMRDGSDALLADDLRKQGVKGFKYLDQGSRSAGDGTRNYVVFDQHHVEMVSRNGEPVGQPKSQLGQMIDRAKSERTKSAFDRQFVDGNEADQAAAGPAKQPPKDKLQEATSDLEAANQIVEDLRNEGRLAPEDHAYLQAYDKAARKSEIKAKAIEAAAACMVSA